jgi:hypothetical protein
MADKKISALTDASTPLAGTEVLPIVQSGSTVKVANNDLRPKQIQSNATSGILQVVGPAAASTRIMTTPDANFTAARTDAAQSLTGDQTFSTGNLIPATAAKGVNFTANTPQAGMTSQLLNWYEAGTWTPNQGLGIVLVGTFSSSATYTRIGRQVTLIGKLQGSTSIANVTNGGAFFSNPPFTPLSNAAGVLINDAQSQTGSGVLATNSTFYITPMSATPTIYFNITYFV